MFNLSKYVEYVFSLPKTIYFCFKYLPFNQAIKLPIVISKNVKILTLKGSVDIKSNNIKFGMIRIGFGSVGIFDRTYSRTMWQNSGKVVFEGTASIGHGSRLSINKNGVLIFKNNFCITAESHIICSKRIEFGEDVLMSWQCLIMDTDFHKIYDMSEGGGQKNIDKNIKIGNHVWIGCRNTILKGVEIPDNCVIAANSNVVKSIKENSTIIAGNPAKIVDKICTWKN